jgi:peptidyl-tRNA hydrolase, PTH1 family
VIHWVLKKPSPDQRELIQACVARSLLAVDDLIGGDFTRATQRIHTSKPARPKPPRPEQGASKAPPDVRTPAPPDSSPN